MKNLLKKLLFVMVFCLVQSALCHADTFKGKIVNAETGEILIGANIFSEVNPQPGWSCQNQANTDSTGSSISTVDGKDASCSSSA